MLIDANAYRESLRRYKPRVTVDGRRSRASPTSRCSRPASPRSASATTSRSTRSIGR